MEKQFIILFTMFFSIAIAILLARSNGFATEEWFQTIFNGKEKVTQLQLYVQDILSGPNPSNVIVASANSTYASPTLFGLVSVLDDPVRTRPNSDAEIVGRAQGLFAYSSLEEISIQMTFDLVFTSGAYNGSTLKLLGRNPYQQANRELSIVGGSGYFRLARGFVAIRTVSINKNTGDAFFQYNITVLHY